MQKEAENPKKKGRRKISNAEHDGHLIEDSFANDDESGEDRV